jgi:hypothetical protein
LSNGPALLDYTYIVALYTHTHTPGGSTMDIEAISQETQPFCSHTYVTYII